MNVEPGIDEWNRQWVWERLGFVGWCPMVVSGAEGGGGGFSAQVTVTETSAESPPFSV